MKIKLINPLNMLAMLSAGRLNSPNFYQRERQQTLGWHQ